MKRKCLYCGKDFEKGDMMVDVWKLGKRLPFDFYVFFAWDMNAVHLDCIRPLPPEKKT